jgi:hypothetical protein
MKIAMKSKGVNTRDCPLFLAAPFFSQHGKAAHFFPNLDRARVVP